MIVDMNGNISYEIGSYYAHAGNIALAHWHGTISTFRPETMRGIASWKPATKIAFIREPVALFSMKSLWKVMRKSGAQYNCQSRPGQYLLQLVITWTTATIGCRQSCIRNDAMSELRTCSRFWVSLLLCVSVWQPRKYTIIASIREFSQSTQHRRVPLPCWMGQWIYQEWVRVFKWAWR